MSTNNSRSEPKTLTGFAMVQLKEIEDATNGKVADTVKSVLESHRTNRVEVEFIAKHVSSIARNTRDAEATLASTSAIDKALREGYYGAEHIPQALVFTSETGPGEKKKADEKGDNVRATLKLAQALIGLDGDTASTFAIAAIEIAKTKSGGSVEKFVVGATLLEDKDELFKTFIGAMGLVGRNTHNSEALKITGETLVNLRNDRTVFALAANAVIETKEASDVIKIADIMNKNHDHISRSISLLGGDFEKMTAATSFLLVLKSTKNSDATVKTLDAAVNLRGDVTRANNVAMAAANIAAKTKSGEATLEALKLFTEDDDNLAFFAVKLVSVDNSAAESKSYQGVKRTIDFIDRNREHIKSALTPFENLPVESIKNVGTIFGTILSRTHSIQLLEKASKTVSDSRDASQTELALGALGLIAKYNNRQEVLDIALDAIRDFKSDYNLTRLAVRALETEKDPMGARHIVDIVSKNRDGINKIFDIFEEQPRELKESILIGLGSILKATKDFGMVQKATRIMSSFIDDQELTKGAVGIFGSLAEKRNVGELNRVMNMIDKAKGDREKAAKIVFNFGINLLSESVFEHILRDERDSY